MSALGQGLSHGALLVLALFWVLLSTGMALVLVDPENDGPAGRWFQRWESPWRDALALGFALTWPAAILVGVFAIVAGFVWGVFGWKWPGQARKGYEKMDEWLRRRRPP